LDPSDDALFYSYPRFVTHVDAGFIGQLTDLYRHYLRPQTHILDLMSSWVSHLPPEMDFAHVEGHGMNAEELAANPWLNHFFVQNLNQNPLLPFPDCTFDAVLNAVSVQYLQQPEQVFAEVHRILKPQGPVYCQLLQSHVFPEGNPGLAGQLGDRAGGAGQALFRGGAGV
jgi:SAM-dependent methyltransferase